MLRCCSCPSSTVLRNGALLESRWSSGWCIQKPWASRISRPTMCCWLKTFAVLIQACVYASSCQRQWLGGCIGRNDPRRALAVHGIPVQQSSKNCGTWAQAHFECQLHRSRVTVFCEVLLCHGHHGVDHRPEPCRSAHGSLWSGYP